MDKSATCRPSDASAGETDGDDVLAAVAAIAHAAVRWWGPSGPAEALPALMTAMAVAARATKGNLSAHRPTQFLALLERPLSEWLPTMLAEPLVTNALPTDLCRDLDAEGGEDPEAERVQAKIGASRKRFSLLPGGGEREYAGFRRFLIEHSVCRRDKAQMALAVSGVGPAELYEDIPAACRLPSPAGSVCYPCPVCGWPMFAHERQLACPWPDCAGDGACYRIETGPPRPMGRWPVPPPLLADEHVRLKRGPWRYTVLPGLVELQLADALAAVENVSVQLWPERDQYDLRVELPSDRIWRADVKDWSNPGSLARRLLRDPPPEEMLVVVPDRRRWQVAVLRDHLAGTTWRAVTVTDLVQEVTRRARTSIGGTRGG